MLSVRALTATYFLKAFGPDVAADMRSFTVGLLTSGVHTAGMHVWHIESILILPTAGTASVLVPERTMSAVCFSYR